MSCNFGDLPAFLLIPIPLTANEGAATYGDRRRSFTKGTSHPGTLLYTSGIFKVISCEVVVQVARL